MTLGVVPPSILLVPSLSKSLGQQCYWNFHDSALPNLRIVVLAGEQLPEQRLPTVYFVNVLLPSHLACPYLLHLTDCGRVGIPELDESLVVIPAILPLPRIAPEAAERANRLRLGVIVRMPAGLPEGTPDRLESLPIPRYSESYRRIVCVEGELHLLIREDIEEREVHVDGELPAAHPPGVLFTQLVESLNYRGIGHRESPQLLASQDRPSACGGLLPCWPDRPHSLKLIWAVAPRVWARCGR